MLNEAIEVVYPLLGNDIPDIIDKYNEIKKDQDRERAVKAAQRNEERVEL